MKLRALVRDAGIDWTIVKPLFFMQNLHGSVNSDTLYAPLGEGRLGLVDVRDIAEFGAHVLAEPATHAGRTYTLTGPASVSMHDAAAELSSVVGTPVRYQPVSPADATGAMIAAGFSPWVAEVSAAEYGPAYANGWGDLVTNDFPSVTGRPATPFATFARDHATHLRAA